MEFQYNRDIQPILFDEIVKKLELMVSYCDLKKKKKP